MDGETRVCPFCGAPPGPGVFCEACGRNLAGVEQLPTASEFAPETTVEAFLEAMHGAGTVEIPCEKQRVFGRTAKLKGWIVLDVYREDDVKPRRYVPGLFLTVDGTFHQLDNELRGHGTRDFPRYEQRVSPEPVEPSAEQSAEIGTALGRLRQ